jgi:hypothetical protein
MKLMAEWRYSFTPRSLYSRGKSPRYPLDRRLGQPQSRSGRCGVDKNILTLPGIEPRPVASHYSDWAIPCPSASVIARTQRGVYNEWVSTLLNYRLCHIGIYVLNAAVVKHEPLLDWNKTLWVIFVLRQTLNTQTNDSVINSRSKYNKSIFIESPEFYTFKTAGKAWFDCRDEANSSLYYRDESSVSQVRVIHLENTSLPLDFSVFYAQTHRLIA